MKKSLFAIAFAFALTSGLAAGAQVYVRIGPPPPPVREVVPVARPGYAWQPGYHRWDGARYVWVPGSYIAPPRPRARWVPGRWRNSPRGYYWMEGHWR